MMKKEEKLTICFHPWMLYGKNDDYDSQLAQIAKRGFNCIRIDDGAGFFRDSKGNIRDSILVSAPFGKYTKFTTYKNIVGSENINIVERLLKIGLSAKKHNIKIVLSNWFFLHTNWFCDETEIMHIFNMSNQDKISYFTDELLWILDLFKKENLIDVIAFVELFNEFDNIPWHRNHTKLTPEEATELRIMHEAAIDRMRESYPDILYAFDTYTAIPKEEIVPRNIDIFNFHFYYVWDVYNAFERGLLWGCFNLDEPEIPEETRYFLKKDILSVKTVASEMNGSVKTGPDWPRRVSLYASIDKSKEKELNSALEDYLKDKAPAYREKLITTIEQMSEIHKKVAPDSKIVMGEGVSYCASPELTFERDSGLFWELIDEQMKYFNEKGFFGTVIATTHAPERSAAWDGCEDLYIRANRIFTDGK